MKYGGWIWFTLVQPFATLCQRRPAFCVRAAANVMPASALGLYISCVMLQQTFVAPANLLYCFQIYKIVDSLIYAEMLKVK